MVDGDDKKIDGEQVPLNSKFSIVIEGIKNYTLKEGKAFPKLSIMMTGETGLVVGERFTGILHRRYVIGRRLGITRNIHSG